MLLGVIGLVFSAVWVGCGEEGLMASLMRVLAFARLSMCDDGRDESGWWDLELFVVLISMRTRLGG